MPISRRQLNRTTLRRQFLLERARLPLPEVVHRVLALQAQEPASPYLALSNRVEDFDPRGLDKAFAEGALVKASLMRITLHAVSVDDYPLLHAAMRPSLRASRLNDRRFKESGLTITQVDDHEPALLAGSTEARTGAQMTDSLRAPFGDLAKNAWWAYRTYAALHHAPTGWPWSFGLRPSFMAAPMALPVDAHEASIDHLVHRYLASFGPATVADIAQFTLLSRGVARAALDRLGNIATCLEGPDGEELHDIAGLEVAADVPAPPRLLPMWESILLAYADRSRVIPPNYRPLVIRRNGDVLPTLLVDGYVAGVWRPRDGIIEATAFERLAEASWAELATEAAELVRLLSVRDPAAYSRFGRSWAELPSAEVRTLPG